MLTCYVHWTTGRNGECWVTYQSDHSGRRWSRTPAALGARHIAAVCTCVCSSSSSSRTCVCVFVGEKLERRRRVHSSVELYHSNARWQPSHGRREVCRALLCDLRVITTTTKTTTTTTTTTTVRDAAELVSSIYSLDDSMFTFLLQKLRTPTYHYCHITTTTIIIIIIITVIFIKTLMFLRVSDVGCRYSCWHHGPSVCVRCAQCL